MLSSQVSNVFEYIFKATTASIRSLWFWWFEYLIWGMGERHSLTTNYKYPMCEWSVQVVACTNDLWIGLINHLYISVVGLRLIPADHLLLMCGAYPFWKGRPCFVRYSSSGHQLETIRRGQQVLLNTVDVCLCGGFGSTEHLCPTDPVSDNWFGSPQASYIKQLGPTNQHSSNIHLTSQVFQLSPKASLSEVLITVCPSAESIRNIYGSYSGCFRSSIPTGFSRTERPITYPTSSRSSRATVACSDRNLDIQRLEIQDIRTFSGVDFEKTMQL